MVAVQSSAVWRGVLSVIGGSSPVSVGWDGMVQQPRGMASRANRACESSRPVPSSDVPSAVGVTWPAQRGIQQPVADYAKLPMTMRSHP